MSELDNTENQQNNQEQGSQENQGSENQEQNNQDQEQNNQENQGSENAEANENQNANNANGESNQQQENSSENQGENNQSEEDAEKAKLFGKPEKYDYSSVMPEGMKLNEEMASKFDTIASKYNMSQEGASEIMALQVEHTQRIQKQIVEAQAKAVEDKVAGYVQALKEDKEIGGANLVANLTVANLAASKLMDSEAQELLAQTGLNNHPKFVKMFYELGKMMQEDNIMNANNHTSEKPTNTAADLYGATTPDKKVR